ncbi:laccase [Aspergillus tetrazonus]
MKTLIFILQCITTAAATTSFSSSSSSSSTIAAVTTSSSLSSQSSTISNTSICDGNTATTRQQWCSYDIYTDYTTTVPETGVIREYYFNLEQITASPDGRERFALAINGSIPGPTIEAGWGDTVIVHVTNSLPDSIKNGTSVHFHGIRQYYTNPMDGVVSITQCPTAPGSTVTYKWRAMQYGTTWYHSHIGLQAWEGLFGGIVIHGPASENYDKDLGVMFLNDWDISTVDEFYDYAQSEGPPTLDNGLINGTNVYGSDEGNQTGWRWNTTFVEGTSYRLRLVNAAVDTHFKFMVDNHTLTVIANDLVPIQPYDTTVLDIAMGQRYDVIITADQASVADSFWLRAVPQEACSENESADNIRGIIYYGSSTSTPKTSAYDYTDSCSDEDPSNLTPMVNPLSVSSSPFYTKSEPVTLGTNAENLFRWKLNSTSMHVDWTDPSLLEIYRNHSVSTFANTSGVVELPKANEWVYVVIETELSVPHPIHLHGHDFVIVAQGTGTYNSNSDNLIDTLGAANLPRRDTAMLKENGYLVIGFYADNPGAWLMHCHIGWHTEEGFAMQFIERYSEIQDLLKTKYSEGLEENCQSWEQYQEEYMVVEDDSGV